MYPVEIGADADAIGPRAAARAAEEAARKRASAKLGDDAKKGARRASSKRASSKRASSRKTSSLGDAARPAIVEAGGVAALRDVARTTTSSKPRTLTAVHAALRLLDADRGDT